MAESIAKYKWEKDARTRKQNYFDKALEMDENSQKQIKTDGGGATFCRFVFLLSTRDA